MVNKRYICAQACQLGGKRYEVGEPLADGVEPNSHFDDTKTGERVKARQPETAGVKDSENQAVGQFDAYKKLIGEHLAKFDKRISALEKACVEAKKPDTAKAKGGNKGKEPEAKEEPEGKEGIVSGDNEQLDNSPALDSPAGN